MKAICFDSSMVFTDTYFVGYLSKATSENIFSTGPIKYIFPKVGHFEH